MSDTKSFTAEEFRVGLDLIHREYFMQVLGLLSHDESLDVLNYVKVPIVTPEGGTYLISILHVDGPTLSLRNLAELSKV